jgi:hypothetical protein
MKRRLPFKAFIEREEPFRGVDQDELAAACRRITNGAEWYHGRERVGDLDIHVVRFAEAHQAEALQRWIRDCRIAERLAPNLGPSTEERAALADAGITGQDRVIGISQGWKLTGAIKTTERKLADGTLSHGGRGLMAWAVSNAKVEPRGNAIVITKQASGTAKTDPLMALFNAVALMSMNPEAAASGSIYDDPELWRNTAGR